MTRQLSFLTPEIFLNPIVVPTPSLDWERMGGRLEPGELAILRGKTYEVIDWDFESNTFILLPSEEWDNLDHHLTDQEWRDAIKFSVRDILKQSEEA